jgi:hypothetical protein
MISTRLASTLAYILGESLTEQHSLLVYIDILQIS